MYTADEHCVRVMPLNNRKKSRNLRDWSVRRRPKRTDLSGMVAMFSFKKSFYGMAQVEVKACQKWKSLFEMIVTRQRRSGRRYNNDYLQPSKAQWRLSHGFGAAI